MAAIHDGWLITQVPKEIQDYWSFHDEFCETDGLMLKRGRVVIPVALRPEALKKLCVSHLGIVCKERARNIVF